jgi:hypothetical protein
VLPEAVLLEAVLPDVGVPLEGDVREADADDVPAAAGDCGAIQIPDSDASRVGWAHDPEVEAALGGLASESDADAVDGDVALGLSALELAAGAFDEGPAMGGIPKPAGEGGFAGAAAPPPAESVSNDPSGSNS